MEDRIFHFNGKEYLLIQSDIHTPLGHTNDISKCGLNGCTDIIDGSERDSHYIKKHTMKEFLEVLQLIKKELP